MSFKYRRSEKLENLLGILRDFSDSDRIMFGQQNCGHIGVSINATDGTESDCKNLTGSHPAIVGVDTLSFLGYEGKMHDLVTVVKNMRRQGLIITLSAHMPNFTLGGEEFYDFCIQNSIYYIRSGNWNTNAKGLAVYQKPDINIPSKDDLLAEIKELKVGMNDEQRSI